MYRTFGEWERKAAGLAQYKEGGCVRWMAEGMTSEVGEMAGT